MKALAKIVLLFFMISLSATTLAAAGGCLDSNGTPEIHATLDAASLHGATQDACGHCGHAAAHFVGCIVEMTPSTNQLSHIKSVRNEAFYPDLSFPPLSPPPRS